MGFKFTFPGLLRTSMDKPVFQETGCFHNGFRSCAVNAELAAIFLE